MKQKFKAWDTEFDCWQYYELEQLFDIDESMRTYLSNWCQFTGLTDKNGVEIYEGDVVNVTEYRTIDIQERRQMDYNKTGYVSYQIETCGYYILFKSIQNITPNAWNLSRRLEPHNEIYNCLEVIGNIYENKNLLEGL